MPFSQEELNDFQRAIRMALVSTSLNDWERNFLRDMQAKLGRSGSGTALSDKQYRQLMKLTRKHAKPKQQGVRRSSMQPGRSWSKHRSRRLAWRPALGLGVAAIALGLVLVFKGAERFPEYFGPLVAVSSSQEVVGRVTRVRDGDTIEVSGIPIRFGSLNCAERDTIRGQRATARMRMLVSGQRLTCHLSGRTSYDRRIGSCRLQDGRDLGGIMIREGHCERFW